MNLEKIANFLNKLMIERNFDITTLQNKLIDLNNQKDIRTIKNWISGKTLPDIDDFMDLSTIFDVGIDDLVDGERAANIDFNTKYPINSPNYLISIKEDKIYNIHQNNLQLIRRTFNHLLRKRIKTILSNLEEREFKFLFTNFYTLSDYCINNSNINSEDRYFIFVDSFNRVLREFKSESLDAKRWEIKKLFIPKGEVEVPEIHDCEPEKNEYICSSFDELDFWEKDMRLSTLQCVDPVWYNPEKHGSKSILSYNERYGKEFNEELVIKDIIKFMIRHGAKLNSYYLNFINEEKQEKRIIDRIEEIYIKCIKPIQSKIFTNNEEKIAILQNTKKNRFIRDCYYSLKISLESDLNPNEMFEIVCDEQQWNHFLLNTLSEKRGIDINRDKKLNDADLNLYFSYAIKEISEFLENEKQIEKDLMEYKSLVKQMQNGDKHYYFMNKNVVGGNSYDEMIRLRYLWNQQVCYKDIKAYRLNKETDNLLEDLDNLNLSEIRDKYFPLEVINNECC